MKFEDLKVTVYADGADIEGMKEEYKKGYVKGFTTNPTLMKKAGVKDYVSFSREVIKEIPDLPLSLEVFADDFETMEKEARVIAALGDNVYVKIPVTNSKGWPTKPISEVAPETPSKHSIEGVVWNLNLDMVESNSGQVISKVYDDVKNLLSVAQFDEGNVLFSKLRPYLNKVVTPDEIGYATTELVPLRPKEDEINKYFLAHLLRSDIFVAYANAIATGTKMPRMPMNSLRSFECILPPMDMQMKFVAIADQADKSKFELKKSIAAIDKVIKSLINENI